MNSSQILQYRQQHLGKNLSVSYHRPLHIVDSKDQYLIDVNKKNYLDATNNVSHVGHCHPHVVQAAYQQLRTLNTNTRYLNEGIVKYAKKLLSTLPPQLCVCYFVNSGSEANELAIRLAKTATGGSDIICVDHAYHGNTNLLIQLSPYKFNGKGGKGKSSFVHVLECPDTYRGKYRLPSSTTNSLRVSQLEEAATLYASQAHEICESIQSNKKKVAAFIVESILGCAGQIVLPPTYLSKVFKIIREHGGICIADEVQVGFGRVGDYMWGFQTQDVVPDIVTMGKPAGNGYPLGVVVTTQHIANKFNNGMEYFNTFGGSNLSCAIGLAVLEVIENEGLMWNAKHVGAYFKEELMKLKQKYETIGDVRGMGLFLGVELVSCSTKRTPAPLYADYVANAMRDRGILIGTDGPFHNVLKIKPPLCFSIENVNTFVSTLESILQTSIASKL